MRYKFTVVPHGVTYPTSQAMNVYVHEDRLRMCRESGGFVRTIRRNMTLAQFFQDWDIVGEHNTVEPDWREGMFDCAECGELTGYVKGPDHGGARHWNGWACPAFTSAEIIRAVTDHPDTYGQVWRIVKDGDDISELEVWDDNEQEWYPEGSSSIPIDGVETKVWSPGYMSWTWEEVTVKRCHCGNDLDDWDDIRCHACERSHGAVLATGQSLPPDEVCWICDAEARDA